AATSHTYITAGTFTAKLTVTHSLNATSAATANITASPVVVNAPSGLTASASSGTVTLKWADNSSNESGFYIERAPSGTTSFTRIGQTGANIVTATDKPSR